MQKSKLKYLFNPQSIAIIGASASPTKMGFRIVKNVVEKNFKGKLYLVNPKGGSVFNIPIFKSIDELPVGIDLAPAIKSCINKKTKFIMILTAGFKETGFDGIKLEEEIKKLIDQSSTNIVGPNCAGLCNTSTNIYATFESYPNEGNISFISQSGSMQVFLNILVWVIN